MEILVRIHKNGKKQFEQNVDQMDSDWQEKRQAKKKFEAEIKYFNDWFNQTDTYQKDKFEYFYGPYTNDK